MKQQTKIGVLILAIGLIAPAFSITANAMNESWGVNDTDKSDFYYTFGIDGEIALPDTLWAYLSDEFRGTLNDQFNNSYEVGYAEAYEAAYDLGYANTSGTFEGPNPFPNPYSYGGNGLEEGRYYGHDNGYHDGYWDLYYGSGSRPEDSGYYYNRYDDYISVEEFLGFPDTEINAVNLKTIYTEFMNMDKIFNLHVHINSTSEHTEYDYDTEYYYDMINMTVQAKVATEVDYKPIEQFMYDYIDTNVRTFIASAFGTSPNILGNYTALLDDPLGGINEQINNGVPILENRAFAWGTGQNITLTTDEIAQGIVYEVLGNFGFDFSEYDIQEPPKGTVYAPLFIPSDLDVGAQIELMKDVANIQLARSHLVYLTGGFNGIMEQNGFDFITNEKQIYLAGNIEDPKWMLGEILDLGSMLFVDQLNEELLDIGGLGFVLDNSTVEADGVFNIQWDDDGVLLNLHAEANVGVNYLPTSVLGVSLVFDLSKGAQTTLNAHFPTTIPTQKSYPSTVNGDWGIAEGDVIDFTTSFDLNVELPQSMWDELDLELWDGMNETYYDWTGTPLPASEEVNSELIFETLMAEIPNVINLQSHITDMLGIDETDGLNSHQYDFIVQYFLAKTPSETEYQPIGMLLDDVYDGFFEAVGTSFPPSFATELQLRLDDVLSMLVEESMIEGTQVSVFDLVQQFVPSTIHLWGISATGPDIAPAFAQELGIVDEFYFDLLSEATALPSIMYTPTDFSFQDVYDELIPFLEADDPDFTEAKFYEFLTNISVDDFYMTDDQIYLRIDVETTDDIFFATTESEDGIKEWIDEVGSEFGEQFLYNSVWAQLVFNWEYDSNGILKNLHLQIGAGMETTNGEEFSLALELDISQGEFNGKNGEFPGEPLIEEYDHWLYPDLVYTVILPQGTDNVVNVDSETHDVHMSLLFTATEQVRLSTQIWGADPSTSDMFLNGTGIFFAIDVDNEAAITFPMNLTVDLRPELIALGEEDLIDLFQIYTWDETVDDWVLEEGFSVHIDMVNSEVVIEITHLSAFAIGVSAEGGGGIFDAIPGFELSFLLFAMLGTASFLYIRKRK